MIIPYSDTLQNDTATLCTRNSIADITYWDPNNAVSKIESVTFDKFPILFTENGRKIEEKSRAFLIKHLNPGEDLPIQPLHNDLIIGIILICALLFSFIRNTSKSKFTAAARFFLFKGINDHSSRETGGLFQGQLKILNVISFFIIGLFAYCAASFYNVIPSGIKGVIFWLICFGIIVLVVFLRHIVCIVTGYMSGEKAVFREYLSGIYLFYRLSALFLFVMIILMSYTMILPASVSFKSAIIVLGIMYLFRIFRLILIFLNRNISIFYLILYLCALEILPVVISVKYFTGLV